MSSGFHAVFAESLTGTGAVMKRYQVGDIVGIDPLAGRRFVIEGEYVRNGDRWYQLANVDGIPTTLNVPVKYLKKIVASDVSSKS